ncbi:Cobalt-zinc-cadmium resistance protein CzcB [Rubripirellula obstinata]|uniref:Cobalt-zinc-cadmium resistance protein CzcB n=1 Tax=Rubripirellula obstinata TaxID=406547 RepID=A0A5B1CFM6_9BACT|nr:efflux RND transporter periplasmic adaptor subunit [Rubripirellula obstinata]KAA1258104.1 Cobalt-zinc-cadmium resistance protein CzcB [Rubripirellula obstinata]
MSTTLDKPDVDTPVTEQPTQNGVPEAERNAATTEQANIASTILGWIPPVLVLSLLAGIGWYGHHNDWKLPSYSSIATTEVASGPQWCDSHGVPEDDCVVCDPSLLESPPELTFCNEHGVHGCVLHHPKLTQTKTPVDVTDVDLQRAAEALSLIPRAQNLPLSSSAGSRIQFATIEAMNKAGVDVEPVTRASITESIEAAGEIQYDATKTAQVSPSADGIVRKVLVNVGDWVKVGDVLAVVDSKDIGRLKSELLSALLEERLQLDQLARVEKLAPSGAVPGSRVIEVKTAMQKAIVAVEQVIRDFANLGVSVDHVALQSSNLAETKRRVREIGMTQIDSSTGGDNLIAVTAPIEGRIVDRDITVGEVVDRGSRMFRIADTRTVWLDLRVAAEQASLARLGLPVRYQGDGSQVKHDGLITWISSDVDPQTRTVRVRAELSNADASLRNESFGRGEIVLRQEPSAIVVPEESLQWDGSSHVVFVRDARFFEKDRPKFFVTRSVRPGAKQDGFVEIIAGVWPGEVVASSGSDVLRAQLLRSNLGAGCTCGH